MIGVLGLDIRLTYIQSLVKEMSNAKRGHTVFIIDGDGAVIAHPHSRYISERYNYKNLTKHRAQQADGTPVMYETYGISEDNETFFVSSSFDYMIRKAIAGERGVSEVTNTSPEGNRENCFAGYAPVKLKELKGESQSWSVINVYKQNEAMKIVYVTFFVCLAVSVFIIVAYSFVIYRISKKFTNSVLNISNAVEEASKGNFSVRADDIGANELVLLAKSFNEAMVKISEPLGAMKLYSKQLNMNSDKLKAAAKDNNERETLNEAIENISAVSADIERVFQKLKAADI